MLLNNLNFIFFTKQRLHSDKFILTYDFNVVLLREIKANKNICNLNKKNIKKRASFRKILRETYGD